MRCRKNFLGTQKRVRISRGKRVIRVRVIEVLLYIQHVFIFLWYSLIWFENRTTFCRKVEFIWYFGIVRISLNIQVSGALANSFEIFKRRLLSYFAAGTQRLNNVDSTLIQHLDVESTLNRRCLTLCLCWFFLSDYDQNACFLKIWINSLPTLSFPLSIRRELYAEYIFSLFALCVRTVLSKQTLYHCLCTNHLKLWRLRGRDSGDMVWSKSRNLTSDESSQCRGCAEVLISRQNTLHT